nr:MAG TPA: hypothetical protein [Caudoviricetes sp.]
MVRKIGSLYDIETNSDGKDYATVKHFQKV